MTAEVVMTYTYTLVFTALLLMQFAGFCIVCALLPPRHKAAVLLRSKLYIIEGAGIFVLGGMCAAMPFYSRVCLKCYIAVGIALLIYGLRSHKNVSTTTPLRKTMQR